MPNHGGYGFGSLPILKPNNAKMMRDFLNKKLSGKKRK